jgi:hypothetical protein
MAHTVSAYTRKTFQETLQSIYDCKYLGQAIAKPYAEQDDMPDQYKSPKGEVFNVPQPSAPDGKYYKWVIDDVIADNKLEIINPVYAISDNKKDAANE